ncbi:MAG TPA: hypothetical protein VFD38_06700 [Myxococcaceae bacterium]|nr:hypothetical protein [Myxococcaceae bacterium]
MKNDARSSGRRQAIVTGGLAVAVLDAVDALVAYKLAFGMSPLAIYQFVASGLLGEAAYAGGVATALLGLFVHFLIAFTAAAVFVLASERLPKLRRDAVPWGLGYGLLVFAAMSFGVIPLSRIPPSTPSLPLLLNGVIGHALLVGLPIALAARRYLGHPGRPALAGATV